MVSDDRRAEVLHDYLNCVHYEPMHSWEESGENTREAVRRALAATGLPAELRASQDELSEARHLLVRVCEPVHQGLGPWADAERYVQGLGNP